MDREDRARKLRLDEAVVERGLVETRARAQAVIMGGGIAVDDTVVTKSATRVVPEARIELVTQPLPYVSRGGLKLAHALDEFGVDVRGAVAADIGASTGGFTDVLLQRGARHIYAIDVGYGQLAWKLRNDERVVAMERTNIRHLANLPELVDLAVVDVSFISLRQVLPHVLSLLMPEAEIVALIKPQFESGAAHAPKGVVRNPAVWERVLHDVLATAQRDGLTVAGLTRSPIQGPKGNVEFLAHLRLGEAIRGIDVGESITRVTHGSET